MDQKVKSGREDFVPQGYYTLFKMTPQEIFSTEPDEKVLRQIIYIGNYLEIFVWLLQKMLEPRVGFEPTRPCGS